MCSTSHCDPYFLLNLLMEQMNLNSGPYQGGTDVTITGIELGVVFEDIINVIIGRALCIIYSDSYQSGIE